MKHLDLFSGIGGFALATEMVWDDVEHIFCDNEPFAQAVLSKHWPNATIYGDIRTLTADAEYERLERETSSTQGREERLGHNGDIVRAGLESSSGIDLLTGGFPCQPFSQAGARRGTEDSRHLWPEMLRVIREFHPRWVIGENVGGLVTWSEGLVLEQIHADLESEGYEVQAFIIPAVSVNAPHRRDRVWIVGNAKYDGLDGSQNRQGSIARNDCNTTREEQVQQSTRPDSQRDSDAPDTSGTGLERGKQPETSRPKPSECATNDSWSQNWTEVAARLCTLDDGLPNGLARPRGWRNAALKGAGNAIVPQVAAEIFKVIKEIDK